MRGSDSPGCLSSHRMWSDTAKQALYLAVSASVQSTATWRWHDRLRWTKIPSQTTACEPRSCKSSSTTPLLLCQSQKVSRAAMSLVDCPGKNKNRDHSCVISVLPSPTISPFICTSLSMTPTTQSSWAQKPSQTFSEVFACSSSKRSHKSLDQITLAWHFAAKNGAFRHSVFSCASWCPFSGSRQEIEENTVLLCFRLREQKGQTAPQLQSGP